MIGWLCCLGQFAGRILLSIIFIVAGVGKLFDFQGSLQYMNAKGIVTLAPLLLIGAIGLELLGGVLLIIGYRARIIAFLLFLFLIPTTFIFHDFWNSSQVADKTIQSIMFFKNLAIMGGLLFLASTTSGTLSLDCKTRCMSSNKEV